MRKGNKQSKGKTIQGLYWWTFIVCLKLIRTLVPVKDAAGIWRGFDALMIRSVPNFIFNLVYILFVYDSIFCFEIEKLKIAPMIYQMFYINSFSYHKPKFCGLHVVLLVYKIVFFPLSPMLVIYLYYKVQSFFLENHSCFIFAIYSFISVLLEIFCIFYIWMTNVGFVLYILRYIRLTWIYILQYKKWRM